MDCCAMASNDMESLWPLAEAVTSVHTVSPYLAPVGQLTSRTSSLGELPGTSMVTSDLLRSLLQSSLLVESLRRTVHRGASSAFGPVVTENERFTSGESDATLNAHLTLLLFLSEPPSSFPPAETFLRSFSPEIVTLMLKPPQK